MVSVKRKNSEIKTIPDSDRKWKKVKLRGSVVSEDGVGLEGLIGLEVMKQYDRGLVTKFKKKSSICKEIKKVKEKTKKSQKTKNKINKNQTPTNMPGKFVLLKPPLVNENKVPEQVTTLDEMHEWNGLGVPDSILRALADNNYKSPTEIQALTLPSAIMGKKDILGAAETGSGKTLAFGIPILAGIMELKAKQQDFGIRKVKKVKKTFSCYERDNCTPPPEELSEYPNIGTIRDDNNLIEVEENNSHGTPLYAVILTPTRELAVQVKDHITSAAIYTGIRVVAIFGGLSAAKQERLLKKCPEIIVATPGRLWELIELGNPHLNKIDNISFLGIDETDRMVEKGHFEELKKLLKRLNNEHGKKESRQNFVFSATLTLVHDLPEHLQKKNSGNKKKFFKLTPGLKIHSLIEELGISHPKIVDITQEKQTAQTLIESRIICPIDEKDFYLYYILQKHMGRTIVFCNSIDCVKRLTKLFTYLDCNPLSLHAQMLQKQRLKSLEKFRENENGLLIATDVAARGLDIPNVQHVIHYQVPRTSENYVHRSGRTARANTDGITILIMEPGEVKTYLKLCKNLSRSQDIPIFPVLDQHFRAVKDRVNCAREVDKMELKLRKTTSEEGWWKKNAEETEILFQDSDDNNSTDDEAMMIISKDKQYLLNKKQTLAKMLSKQLFPKGFNFRYPASNLGKLDSSFSLSMKLDENSAVKAMKESIENNELKRKKKSKSSFLSQ